jgi:hypothetical protein
LRVGYSQPWLKTTKVGRAQPAVTLVTRHELLY